MPAGTVGIVTGNGNKRLYFVNMATVGVTNESTLATWLAANQPEFVYELATPVTYQLTPTQVATLLGDNNIWADTGDVSVTYRADTALYIQKMLNL